MILFHVLFFAAFTYNVRYSKEHKPFDMKTTTCIKGVCAIYVLFHHIGQFLNLQGLAGRLNGYLGGVAVGVFFMLSAYGLIISYKKNGVKYLKKVLLIKIPKLYLMLISTNLLYFLFFHIGKMPWYEALIRIFSFDFVYSFNRINPNAWFITSILIIYGLFVVIFFACRNLKNKHIAPIILSSIIVLIYFLVKIFGGIPHLYVRSILCFVIGIIYAMNYEFLNKVFNKYFLLFALLFAGLTVAGVAFDEHFTSAMVCLFIIVFSQRFTFANRITYFLGVISLEIYLLQNIAQRFLTNVTNEYLYVFLVFLVTIAMSVLYKLVLDVIKLTIRKTKERIKFNRQLKLL